MFFPRHKSVIVKNNRMDYVVFGNGSQPLVLIPGLGTERIRGQVLQLAYFYRCFSKAFRVYIFDRKDSLDEGCSITDMTNDLATAMASLGIIKAHIVGVSQGGMIAQELAVSYPQLVDRLVLALTTATTSQSTQEIVSNWISLATTNHKDFYKELFFRIFSEKFQKRFGFLVQIVSPFLTLKDTERFVVLAQSILQFDNKKNLHLISCPTLVIGAQDDRVIPVVESKELARVLQAELFIYNDCGHSAYFEVKDFNHRILSFLLDETQ